MTSFRHSVSLMWLFATAATVALIEVAGAQTRITAPKNKFTPEQDVKLGREAAAEIRKQYPVVTDAALAGYLERLGKRLVAAAPAELNNPVFEYSFTPVNLKEINAFALPGGPMFVNRGMFEAATGEGEVVGVMAHELSHVLLRHGTANATKAQGFQLGQLAGAIAGAVVGGGWGQLISEGSQFGLGTAFLKYSREYQKQADLLGAQIMARAGYDPRDLGRMFETIQKESRGGGPQWLSSHPDPGNRSAYIAKEAAMLQISPREAHAAEFKQARGLFAALPPAQSMAELERARTGGGAPPAGGRSSGGATSVGRIGDPVPPPSAQFRTAQGGNLFEVAVPQNWTSRVLDQRREVRAAERLRCRRRGRERLHARRRARRRARLLAQPRRRDAHARRQFRPQQSRSAADVRPARHPAGAAEMAKACRSSTARPSAEPSGSASTRRCSPTGICSTWRRSCPTARPSATDRCSSASRDRSGCAM